MLRVASAVLAVLACVAALASPNPLTSGGMRFASCTERGPGTDWVATLGFSTPQDCETYVASLTVVTGPSSALFGYPRCNEATFCFSGKLSDPSWQLNGRNAESGDTMSFLAIQSVADPSTGPQMAVTFNCGGSCSTACSNIQYDQTQATCGGINGGGLCQLSGRLTNVFTSYGIVPVSINPILPQTTTTTLPPSA